VAGERIQAAYDPRLIKSAGRMLADQLAGHLQKVQNSESVVLNWAEPSTCIADAAAVTDAHEQSAGTGGDSLDGLTRRFGELVEMSLARGINLHDPRYVGHQVPAPFRSPGCLTRSAH
jgi:hypothetical protein